ncbi:MAG TPA: hypothetical protein VLC50_05510 [Actinomycetes bacterium]|nr:hypothetical protein [Actinomycetes bacterium]
MGAETPSWSQMLGRMAGFGARTATGALRFRDPGIPADADAPERAEPREGTCRFWYAAPDRWRVEDERGVWHVQDDHWINLRDDQGRMQRLPREGTIWGFALGHPQYLFGSSNDRLERFTRDNDFSLPMGPATAVTVAGRSAWEFVLAPPPHKPHPLRVAFDDATGVVVRMAVPELSFLIEITELAVNLELDAQTFTWTGPVATDQYDDIVGQARAREWLEQQRVPVPRWWPDGLGYSPASGDPETGALSVELSAPGEPMLARWPIGGAQPPYWDLRTEGRHVHTWSDGTWQWALAVTAPLTDDDLARVIASIPAK